ncbi:hypothetical protein Tco_1264075 [Tanacetum coccineum]
MPYPSSKIRRIRACTYQRPQMDKAQYAVSRETQYAVFKKYKSYIVLGIAPVAIIDRQLPFEYTITSRSTDVVVMKGYVDQLEHLGYMLPHDLIAGLILNGLTKDFAGFVRNYNTHNMGKTIGELHAMLIEYEKGLPKKAETPRVMMIKGGKIQKANKKSLKAKGKGKANGKRKDKQVYIPKPKNPKPSAIEHPAKDDTCHHYKEDYALESATCILNMVPTKKVDKTPYELWYGKVPNLSYLKVWGCEALMKRDTPDKLQQRSVKCIFIGYPKETMGYYFYFLPKNKIVVAMYAEFFKKNLITQEVSGRAMDLEEIQSEDTSPSEITSEIPMEVKGFEPPQEEVISIRRSKRTHQALDHLCLNVEADEHSLGDLNEPTSYKAAMLDSESNKWIDAMNAEIQSMMDNMVWFLIDIPPGWEATFILGIKIYRDISKRFIGLGQNAYMDKILKRYKMDNSKRGHIPMQERLDLNKTQGASTPKEVKRMQNVPYASAVGSIMYAVRCTRPDVVFAQNITNRFQQNPSELH